MATFLDISILGHFTSVFTFLLVFVIIYGMLEVFNVFGEGRRGLHAIIALAMGFIVIFTKSIVTVIQTFTPWFTVLILLIFFILFAVRMFGAGSGDIKAEIMKDGVIVTWIIVFTVIILLFSLGSGFGQKSLEEGASTTPSTSVNATAPAGSTATGSFNQNLYNTLYHPKVLGLVLIMLIAIIAMLFLTAREGL
ncbi:TPA: hypothetical protein HA235_04430 [Candidatus Woesearchaeota archaeon]|nr:hypothetical protein [Candidatus Woesearchaeota archaeon]HIH31929.1 hypothetical protein [Candidatus Woesearchaeota archaeon]HIH55501.1 hypothetical protein [Candidatus Woesearchaeota archaeon]HIJ01058.1 hypothetical protein [Candidatus Woesearchaeota archaeon]HIJ14717.1 hypothetical protein [Candidatus Woesearchaeota archaeon]